MAKTAARLSLPCATTTCRRTSRRPRLIRQGARHAWPGQADGGWRIESETSQAMQIEHQREAWSSCVAIRCLVKIENEASMWTFASMPVVGDWVQHYHGR